MSLATAIAMNLAISIDRPISRPICRGIGSNDFNGLALRVGVGLRLYAMLRSMGFQVLLYQQAHVGRYAAPVILGELLQGVVHLVADANRNEGVLCHGVAYT